MPIPIEVFCVAIAMLALAGAFSLLRLIRGPGFADRLVAFDLLAIVAMAALALLALYFGQSYFWDILMVWAILSFLTTVTLARHAGAGSGEVNDGIRG